MARAKTILQSLYPYNISARCINKEWFNLDLDLVWEIFCEELYITAKIYSMNIHMFILMNNHFHLIASTPEANISKCMHRFMGVTSRRLNESGNRINGTWAGRHYKTILHHPNYFLCAYKYNYRNPVSAGVCDNVEDYKYSSLHGLLGQSKILVPLVEDPTLFADVNGTLGWLNKTPEQKKLEAVRYALKRPYFKFKKCPVDNKPVMGESDAL